MMTVSCRTCKHSISDEEKGYICLHPKVEYKVVVLPTEIGERCDYYEC